MRRSAAVLLSVFAGGTLSLAAAGTACAQQFPLRWGHYLADGPFVQLEKDYAAKVEKRTNGRVKITITFAGGLGKGEELLLLNARGAIDMTATPPGYNPDQLRYWRAFQTPFVFQTTQQAMMVLAKVYEEFPAYRDEMDKVGVVWLFQQPLGEYYLTGPSPDCSSVAALRGKKIRSFGADVPKAFSAIGAVPVTVAPTAIYEGLQHRNIDFSFINAGNIQQYKLFEVGKHNCGTVMAITGHNITIGKRTWARLPPDIQQIMVEEGRQTMKDYIAWVDDFEAKAVANIKAAGGTFTAFPPDELKKWRAAAPDFLAEWEKATAQATGDAETPKKVAARWRQLIAQ